MATDQPSICQLEFKGRILKRGFWLYVWRIRFKRRTVLYVGRTGDSSSDFASSPFVRIGRHLDLRPNAKSNSLARHLKAEGLDATECDFQFVAFGPLFPEQKSTNQHRHFRDRTGALEALLANMLHARGYKVVGKHHSRAEPAAAEVAQLMKFLDTEFPPGRNT